MMKARLRKIEGLTHSEIKLYFKCCKKYSKGKI